jgi:cytochrome P450
MQIEAERDYFTDLSVLRDPYQFFREMASRGPVFHSDIHDLVFVSGFEEALEVLRNNDDYSSVISTGGPVAPLPFEPVGDDITDQIEAFRDVIATTNLLVTYDGSRHAASRSILNRMFVPSRLKANEEFMVGYATQMVKAAITKGGCDLIREIATPFATIVVADLLGVPADDREKFAEMIAAGPPPGNMDAEAEPDPYTALQQMAGYFAGYIADRRANPRPDVLTELATATFPDGTLPEIGDVVLLAIFLFAAGQDTSAKLLGNCLRYLVENKDMQLQLRQSPELLPAFIEETLRLEGSTKATFRLARKTTSIGGREIKAGEKIVILFGAANRDPRRWEDPDTFKLDRPKIKEHLAFGRGAHTCVGAPLARVEVRVMLEQFLALTSDISLSEKHHGPPDNRRLDYEPSYIIRGLEELHLELKPA